MNLGEPRCVLLADRHHGLAEGLRGLLETSFDAVVMVADTASLFASARRLRPTLAVVDLSLNRGEDTAWLHRFHEDFPGIKLIVLSVHDEPSVCRLVLAAGADGFVLKRTIATELLPAVDAILAGHSYAATDLVESGRS